MLRNLLYAIVEAISRIHGKILGLNDSFEYSFSDKELHFIVIGILGMLMLAVIYPLFRWLANRDHIMTISWIYVFTLIIVITFAIEIGQKVSNTGVMEFSDIMFGLLGFLLMYTIFAIVREIGQSVYKAIKKRKNRKEQDQSKENIEKMQ